LESPSGELVERPQPNRKREQVGERDVGTLASKQARADVLRERMRDLDEREFRCDCLEEVLPSGMTRVEQAANERACVEDRASGNLAPRG
jgi:hypothetical protein